MVDSGIRVNDEAATALKSFELIKTSHYKWCILKIKKNEENKDEVAIEECPEGGPGFCLGKDSAEWEELYNKFKDGKEDPFIAVCYIKFDKGDQGEQNKLIAIKWCPDTAKMKFKMIYSSTFKTVTAVAPKLNGKVEAADLDDVEFDAIVASLAR